MESKQFLNLAEEGEQIASGAHSVRVFNLNSGPRLKNEYILGNDLVRALNLFNKPSFYNLHPELNVRWATTEEKRVLVKMGVLRKKAPVAALLKVDQVKKLIADHYPKVPVDFTTNKLDLGPSPRRNQLYGIKPNKHPSNTRSKERTKGSFFF